MSIFERFGDVYGLLIDEEKRWAVEGPFLAELAAQSGTGAGRVLDLGCGTGFHARHLAAAGRRVTGADTSAAMLEAARRRTPGHVRIDWRRADATAPLPGTYDTVLLLGNTLSLLPEPAAFFRSAAGALCRGGSLLVHLLDYATLRAQGLRHTARRGEIDGRDTVLTKVLAGLAPGGEAGRAGGALLGFTVWQERAGAWQRLAEETLLRDLPDGPLLRLALESGFRLVARYSGLDRSSYRPGRGADRVFLFERG
jgi:SAM-dependent methyltransferase